MHTHEVPEVVFLRVFGYREEGDWVALALEMDLRGYGETFDAALEELNELVEAQISFAAFKGQPEMIWKTAEPVWFGRFEAAWHEALVDRVAGRQTPHDEAVGTALPIPPAHVIERLKAGFSPASA